jgi:hypothetical protein
MALEPDTPLSPSGDWLDLSLLAMASAEDGDADGSTRLDIPFPLASADSLSGLESPDFVMERGTTDGWDARSPPEVLISRARQSSADGGVHIDDPDVSAALGEPPIDSLLTLSEDTNAVVSLSLTLRTPLEAIEAEQLLPMCDKLTALRLGGPVWTNGISCAPACEAVKAAPRSLLALDLGGATFHDMAPGALAEAVEAFSHRLRALRLSDSGFGGCSDAASLLHAIGACKRLSRLELASCKVDCNAANGVLRAMAEALQGLDRLRVLDLSGNQLEEAGADLVGGALCGGVLPPLLPRKLGRAVRSVESGEVDYVPEPQSPTEPVAPEQPDPYADVSRGAVVPDWSARPPEGPWASLRCLMLAGTCIHCSGGSFQLCRSLATTSGLLVLSLAECDFGAGAKAPCAALGYALEAHAESLRALDLGRCRLWEQGVVTIAEALGKCHRLLSLVLCHNDMGTHDGGLLTPLGRSLFRLKDLRELDLSHNSLGRLGLKAIAPAIASLSRLRSLGLECNNIDSHALEFLATEFRDGCAAGWPELVSLRLGGNLLRSDGLALLAEHILPIAPNLQHLSLHACRIRSSDLELLTGVFSDAVLPSGDADHLVVARLRSLDLHDNDFGGVDGGHALLCLLRAPGISAMRMLDVRRCCIDNACARELASHVGSIAWMTRFLRVDLQSNPELTFLPQGLACFGELSVDADSITNVSVGLGEDGVAALRRQADDSNSDSSTDSSSDEEDDDHEDDDHEEEEEDIVQGNGATESKERDSVVEHSGPFQSRSVLVRLAQQRREEPEADEEEEEEEEEESANVEIGFGSLDDDE